MNAHQRLRSLCRATAFGAVALGSLGMSVGVGPLSSPAAVVHADETAPTYTVRPGDYLWRISRITGTSLTDLLRLNGLRITSIIHPGQVLRLAGPYTSASGGFPPAPVPGPTPSPSGSTYTVRSGDGFYRISRRTGVPIDQILQLNGLSIGSMLHPGQVLRLSADGTSPPPAAPAAPPATSPASSTLAPAGSTLNIPAIGLNQSIHVGGQGTIDAGHVTNYNGCWPGSGCTIWLAGHRTSHGAVFANLTSVSTGSTVTIWHAGIRHDYQITGREGVPRSTPASNVIYGDLVLQTSIDADNVWIYHATEL